MEYIKHQRSIKIKASIHLALALLILVALYSKLQSNRKPVLQKPHQPASKPLDPTDLPQNYNLPAYTHTYNGESSTYNSEKQEGTWYTNNGDNMYNTQKQGIGYNSGDNTYNTQNPGIGYNSGDNMYNNRNPGMGYANNGGNMHNIQVQKVGFNRGGNTYKKY